MLFFYCYIKIMYKKFQPPDESAIFMYKTPIFRVQKNRTIQMFERTCPDGNTFFRLFMSSMQTI
jgi:hypothetical protein